MEGALKCDICSENFLSQSNFNLHMTSDHEKPAVLSKKGIECSVCGMKLNCNNNLISHMRTHTGERPFKCIVTDCGKEFAQARNLECHMRVHTGERPFKCTVTDCGKKFAQRAHLKSHMRVHTGERPFKCTVTDCGKEFADARNLKSHMRVHTGDRPFKCTVTDCQMEFKRQSHLQEHIKGKHSDKRPLECTFPDCLFTTKTSGALISHKKKHNVERPFACGNEGCNYRAKRKEDLKTHLTRIHSAAKTAECSEFDSKTTRKGYFKHYMRHQNSLREDNSKCSHPECVEYLICSHDLDCLQSNQNEESNIQCDQSSLDQRFADANTLRDTYRYVNSGQSLNFPNLDYSYSTSALEDLHTLEADNQENIEPNQIQTSLSKDEEYSYIPDGRPGRDESEQEFFHQGFNWQDILQSSSL